MVRVEGVYPVKLLSKVVDIAVCSRFLEWRPLEGRVQGTIGHGGEWLGWPTLVACLPWGVILMGRCWCLICQEAGFGGCLRVSDEV